MRPRVSPVRPTGGDGPGHRPSLAQSTAVMAAGTLASRVTGFARLVALAYALGFTRLTDSYNLANITPNIIYELVLGGVLSATLVPVFVDRLAPGHDEDDAWRAISAVVTAAAAVLVVVTALFVFLAPLLVHVYTLGNDTSSVDEQRAVATSLLRLFAPQVALYGMVTVTTAILHARRRFAAPMFAPVLNNLVVIGVLLALPHVVDEVSLSAVRHDVGARMLLGLGTTAGVAAMALALLPALRRAGPRLRPVWEPGHPAVRTIVRLSGWTFGFVAANQAALMVVLVLANGRAGDVAAYQAGQVFFLLPHGVFAVSVMTALQPDMAERWALGDRTGYGRDVGRGLRTIAAVVVPAAVGYLCLARPIVGVALEHGALRSTSASTTADVLAMLAIGLPGFSAFLFLMKAFQAVQDTRSVFFLYLVENGANVVLAVALYPSLGVQGLALAYGLAYTIGTAAALVVLQRRTRSVDIASVVQIWVRVAVASAVMGAVVAALSALPGPALLRAGGGVVAGVTVYLLVARRLGVQELSTLLPMRRRLL
ncbi:MAG TPA: murein biosynthesis integral membrane protein MurJ [Acidimicrobiales bacterium]|nr:murein biosynthesis integral membrane protein MurJ [Acidimicrobiales bacterium]